MQATFDDHARTHVRNSAADHHDRQDRPWSAIVSKQGAPDVPSLALSASVPSTVIRKLSSSLVPPFRADQVIDSAAFAQAW
jgi:hypothetical protein